ncbi:MAG: hypothetical protein IAE80_03805 [Anaerolinea sp.]|nr:hypothetical protein [Anaerolinea sp.]
MRLKSYFWLIFGLSCALIALSACGGDAVIFAPTPPADASDALRYDHPGGAFSVSIPRNWALYEQNTTTLATAAFAAPGSTEPALLFAVINLGRELTSAEFGDLLNLYQAQVRSDVGRYAEQSRQAMGDGSWRITGLREIAPGTSLAVNTFIQQAGTFIGLTEVVLPADAIDPVLQTAINTFTIHADAPLQPTDLTTLAFAKNSDLGILHVSAWTTRDGVFFVTGEVANYGLLTVRGLPVEAALVTADGLEIVGAVDQVMGYGIPPGGFAPFSLRFGGGQPSTAASYTVRLGTDWTPIGEGEIYGAESLTWTDESTFDASNRLIVRGSVTNISDHPITGLRATVTVFDSAQNVIGAVYSDLSPAELEPGASLPFEIPVPEIGGEARNYILNLQGLP